MFYTLFYSFRAQSIIGKCTSRHLFPYGGLCINYCCEMLLGGLHIIIIVYSQEYFTTIVYAKLGGQTECINVTPGAIMAPGDT